MGQNVHAITLDDATFSVARADGTFIEVPGVANFASAGGEATPNVQRYYGGNLVLTSSPTPGTITVDDIAITPLHESYDLIRAAVQSRGQLTVGLETDPAELILDTKATRTVAVSAPADKTYGECTFAMLGSEDFSTEKYGHNDVLVITGDAGGLNDGGIYAINDISVSGGTAGDVKVYPKPSAAITAKTFKVIRPKFIFRPIVAKVLNTTTLNVNAPADGAMNGTLTLQLVGDLPKPTVDIAVAA